MHDSHLQLKVLDMTRNDVTEAEIQNTTFTPQKIVQLWKPF
jgi:hypothetical protein